MKEWRLFATGFVCVALTAGAGAADWPVRGGSSDNIRYSRLNQITPENVAQLQPAWTYDTRDAFEGSEMQCNPVVVDGVAYITSPKLRVMALDAKTGRELWAFDPSGGQKPNKFRNRGVVVHDDRVFVTYRNFLLAIDKRSGKPVASFGDNGRVDLRQGLERPIEGVTVSASSPGVIFEDMLILGSTVSETLPGSPGDLRAYDVHSGKLRWIFHTIPHPGEFGYDTWPKDAWKVNGGANAWAGVTIDKNAGMLFASTGSASFDFYGSNRIGDNLFANCILALDARTGKRIWYFQGVHHDVWDTDFPAAPSLVTVTREGKPVEALAQITKTGHVYVFERKTGAPLFPIETRKAPASPVDGEKLSTTQPLPLKPPAFTRQKFSEDMITTRTQAAHDDVLARFRKIHSEGLFYPPTLEGTMVFPGFDGGGEWGGAAFDPETALLYVNANEMPWVLRLVARDEKSLYKSNCAGCHRDDLKGTTNGFPSLVGIGERKSRAEITTIVRQGAGRMPGFASLGNDNIRDIVDYLLTGHDTAANPIHDANWQKYRSDGYNRFVDPEGFPALTPPWGTLNAIDLNRGEIRWSIPLGEFPKLAAQGLKDTGSDNYGGPVVTANGLVFIAATNFDNKIRAFDKLTGRRLWEGQLPAAGNATPSLYEIDGHEYLLIACGGGKNGAASGGSYVAFSLPR